MASATTNRPTGSLPGAVSGSFEYSWKSRTRLTLSTLHRHGGLNSETFPRLAAGWMKARNKVRYMVQTSGMERWTGLHRHLHRRVRYGASRRLEVALWMGRRTFRGIEVHFWGAIWSKREVLTYWLEEDDYTGSKGSGALAASSEADPWGRTLNGGPWNTETSPTTTHSTTGSSSPIRHRSSIPNNDMKIPSSYFPSQHPTAIGQGSSTGFGGRPQGTKSNLNPHIGAFKTASFGSFSLESTKETPGIHPSLDIDQSPRAVRINSQTVQNTGYLNIGSRDGSLPPSRHSESGQSITSHNPPYANASNPYGNYSHTPNNSVSFHRPSLPTQTFPSQNNGRSYTDSANAAQAAELSQNLSRFSFSEKPTMNGGNSQSPNNEHAYSLQNTYSNYDFQPFPQSSMYGSVADGPKGYGASTPDGYPDQPFAHQYAASFRVPRNGERSTNSPAGSDHRRGLGTPYYSTGGTPPTDTTEHYRSAPRDSRAQVNGDPVAYIDKQLQNLRRAQPQPQQYYPYTPQFQNQYSTQAYEQSAQSFPQVSGYRFDLSVPSYPPSGPAPRGPARDSDIGHGVRSLLLDEFRSNSKLTKRYELKVCVRVRSNASLTNGLLRTYITMSWNLVVINMVPASSSPN